MPCPAGKAFIAKNLHKTAAVTCKNDGTGIDGVNDFILRTLYKDANDD